MFGKKKAPLQEGIRLMHYEGLPGFAQDAPCFMEQTAEALVFRRVEGPSVTLPLAKVDSLDIMDERNFAAKYRGTSPNTSRTNAVKWYAVFTYGDKHVAVWFLGGKESKELYALKKQIDSTGQDITLSWISAFAPTSWERACAIWAASTALPEARWTCSKALSVVSSAEVILLSTALIPSLRTICDLIVAIVSPPWEKLPPCIAQGGSLICVLLCS